MSCHTLQGSVAQFFTHAGKQLAWISTSLLDAEDAYTALSGLIKMGRTNPVATHHLYFRVNTDNVSFVNISTTMYQILFNTRVPRNQFFDVLWFTVFILVILQSVDCANLDKFKQVLPDIAKLTYEGPVIKLATPFLGCKVSRTL